METTGKSAGKGSQGAEKNEAKTAEKQAKAVARRNGQLNQTSVAALAKLQPRCKALETLAKKLSSLEDEEAGDARRLLADALQKMQAWCTACKLTQQQSENLETAAPELPFDTNQLKETLKASFSLAQEAQTLVPKPKAKAKTAPGGEAAPKRRRTTEQPC